MVATLTRVFGVHNLALAEDVVQDAFCRALEVWNFRGVPEDPQAWLMATAKNRALDVLRRQRTARAYALELRGLLESEGIIVQVVDALCRRRLPRRICRVRGSLRALPRSDAAHGRASEAPAWG